jgi:hypothetical protein
MANTLWRRLNVRLILDDYNQVYVWVDDLNENEELSPHFDYEEDAIQWQNRMRKELKHENS